MFLILFISTLSQLLKKYVYLTYLRDTYQFYRICYIFQLCTILMKRKFFGLHFIALSHNFIHYSLFLEKVVPGDPKNPTFVLEWQSPQSAESPGQTPTRFGQVALPPTNVSVHKHKCCGFFHQLIFRWTHFSISLSH